MLLPHQWAVLTVEEATILMQYIEKSTATKSMSRNYDKMEKVGVLEIYNKLREFVEYHRHQQNLLNLDLSQF